MILVTGATGHIGNVLVRQLTQLGARVRALVLPDEDRLPIENLTVECVEGDVLDRKSLERAFWKVQIVYHLAGIISILPGQNKLVQRVNVDGTQNVIDAAIEAGVHRLVYTSSIHAIARISHGTPVDESVPFDPQHAISAYDRSKAEASLLVQQAARKGLDAVIACPTGVVGPYDFRRSEMGSLIRRAMTGKLQWVVEGAYDFVDVRDVAMGLVQLAERGRTGETYLLSGEQTSLGRLMGMAAEAAGVRMRRLRIPDWMASATAPFTPLYYRLSGSQPLFTPYALATVRSNSLISHAKASHELGYSPRSLNETIADAVHWFRENRAGG